MRKDKLSPRGLEIGFEGGLGQGGAERSGVRVWEEPGGRNNRA